MFVYILALVLAIQSGAPSAPADDVKDALAKAEALYFQARFGESVQLLLRTNEMLQNKNDRLKDKIAVKQQLALAYIGMNNTAAAKALLVEIYGLDNNYTLDPQQFSPKVIALASDARAEQSRAQCATAGVDARKNLDSGNASAVLDILRTARPKCPELAAVEPAAAELFYKKGVAEYKRSEFSESAKSLRVALQFAPAHELAAQYLELAQSRLQVMEDRILLQWQGEFETRQYPQAAADYRQMLSMKDMESAAGRAKAEYRKALSGLVKTWNQTCPTGDWARMQEIRTQITDMLPEPGFGEDLRATMMPCEKSAAKPEPPPQEAPLPEIKRTTSAAAVETKPSTKQTQTCLQMDPVVALTRLKYRVEPEFPREARAFVQNSKVNVNIKTRIDESGSVKVVEVQGGNPVINGPVRTAVERWKFSPALDPNGPRCVDTDIPMTIGR